MSSTLRLLKTVTPSGTSRLPELVKESIEISGSSTPSPVPSNCINKSFSTLKSLGKLAGNKKATDLPKKESSKSESNIRKLIENDKVTDIKLTRQQKEDDVKQQQEEEEDEEEEEEEEGEEEEREEEEKKEIYRSKDLTDVLIKLGYQILGYLICEEKGQPECKYIKVKDNIGMTFYVQPDVDGIVPIDKYKITKTRVVNDGKIPYSLKKGSLEVISPHVNGVAWECDNEICILSFGGSKREADEKIFVLDDTQTYEDNLNEPITFPTVKMSEMLKQPHLLTENIKQALLKLRNIELAQCENQLNKLKTSMSQLYESISTYENYRYQIGFKLIETINNLNLMYEDYLHHQQYTSDEEANLRIIEYNLKIRLDKLTELIQLTQSISQRYYRLDQLTKEFDDLNKFVSFNFTDIDKVHPLPNN